MTYTFKLSRRLAQFWCATAVAASFLTLSCVLDSGPNGPPPDPNSIVIAPDSTWAALDQTIQFDAVTAVSETPFLTWGATGGEVDITGKYTAGKATGKYRVIAKMLNGVADTAVVTIIAAAQVVATPASVELQTGATAQFTASAQMIDGSTSPVAVTWSASGGTISSTGLYTAGQTAGSYRAIAAQPGGTLADTCAITITTLTSPPPPGVPILPGESIQAAVNANSAGTAFLIKAGRHVRQSVVPKHGNTFRCESGAILDGETVTPHAFRRSGGDPDDVRIVGCVIERYAPAPQMGAILAGGHSATDLTSGWIVDSTEVRNNANVGIRLGHRMKVRWSYIHHNSQLGIGGNGDDILIEGNEIAYNNPDTLGLGFEAGGTKFVLTNGLVVRNNYAHNNQGPGLWVDIGNDSYTFEGNLLEDNLRGGIIAEISYAGVIRNNICRRNGVNDSRSDNWLWGAAIGVHASGGTGLEIYGNTLEGNAHGVALIQQARGSGRLGPYLVQNVWVHDNTVIQPTGMTGAVQDIGDNAIFTSRNNRFTHNTYHITGNGFPFAWMNSARTETEWQGFGQDATGTFIR